MTKSSHDYSVLMRSIDFAAEKHSNQRRKGANASPYINHPIKVAKILAEEGQVENIDTLVAAILHDTLEDTETTPQEINDQFSFNVCQIVLEVTDDKTLPKEVRKRQQVEKASHKSDAAKQIKIADKISNIREIIEAPPQGWGQERKKAYLNWAIEVTQGLKGVNKHLDQAFEKCVSLADKIL